MEVNENDGEYYGFDTYGGMSEVIETQSEFIETVTNDYIKLIENRNEPIVILLQSKNSENKFIIDGHHKFFAYGRLKKDSKCLLITRLDSPKIGIQEGINLIELTNSRSIEYKKRFLERVEK